MANTEGHYNFSGAKLEEISQKALTIYLDNYFHFPGWKLNRSIPKSLYKTAEHFLLNQLGRSCQSDKFCFLF